MRMQQAIENKLTAELRPTHLVVLNESSGHNVPPGSETHFKVTVVAERFGELRAVQRHRAVYQILDAELANGVHALALHLYSPEEWAKGPAVQASPACAGGKG